MNADGTASRRRQMIAIWVKVRVKPERRGDFLKAIEVDALGSERDEPGCARFNVLQDAKEANTFYFYEVYKDEAALSAPRGAALCGVARRGRHARRPDRGDPL